ncbi:MAG: 5'-nucleotidase, lipoprotein e(P4) family [Bradymonadia bacterium]
MNGLRWMGVSAMATLTACGGGYQPTQSPQGYAVVWQQTAAEYKATAWQTYMGAKGQLDAALADKTWTAALEQTGDFADKPPAIVLDVDETVLDNSPFQVRAIESGVGYPTGWIDWCKEAQAKPIPGAVEFTQYAASKGVTVFYVTNRDVSVDKATEENLKATGFPMKPAAGPEGIDTVLTQKEKPDWGSDKTPRRAMIAEHYRIVMLFGDNLGDFVAKKGAAKGTRAERDKVITDHAERWGKQWFMLPNPMYGYWADEPFGYDFSQSEEDRMKARLKALDAQRKSDAKAPTSDDKASR